MMFVDKTVALERYSICLLCQVFAPLVKLCQECHCFMPMKVRLAGAACPQGQWHAHVATVANEYDIHEE